MGPFINKWVHLLSVIGMLGGVFFALAVLRTTPRGADDGAAPLWRRFGMLLGALWIVVLITGFVNVAIVGPTVNSGYWTNLGAKIGLALAMFVLSLLVAHPIPALEGLQAYRASILGVVLVFGIIVVGISARLNMSRVSGMGLKRLPGAVSVAPPQGAMPSP